MQSKRSQKELKHTIRQKYHISDTHVGTTHFAGSTTGHANETEMTVVPCNASTCSP
jgi:hypothetical protein